MLPRRARAVNPSHRIAARMPVPRVNIEYDSSVRYSHKELSAGMVSSRPARSVTILALVLLCIAPLLNAQPQQPAPGPVDLPKLSDEATTWLRDLIRINTTNPPGNELIAARYLSDILTREQIPNEVFETAPGRGLLIARLNAGPISESHTCPAAHGPSGCSWRAKIGLVRGSLWGSNSRRLSIRARRH